MLKKPALYSGYTLAEVLVVLMVIIILGALGASAFGGLRDSVLGKQNIEDIKQDLQLVQQKAMLLEKKSDEGWIYGIGIDFTEIDQGKYTFFKWCSPFSAYGHKLTRSEILAYDDDKNIGYNELNYGHNASLPVNDIVSGGLCNRGGGPSYITPLSGLEEGKLNAGFNIALKSDASYVVFESVTGRVFLYKEADDLNPYGLPFNYNEDGEYLDNGPLIIEIHRNQGKIVDEIKIFPLSGAVTHDVIKK
ncbi:MAG: type II secretion system protein [Candidatus Dojkabacteria bacterium]|jgi:type II secretory pathway pseudopilin PulG